MSKYYLAYDDGNIIIRITPKAILERYDHNLKSWIFDVELCRIFFGSIPVNEISEEEAYRRIKEHV